MIEFNIKIADKVFSVITQYENTLKMCKNYLTNEKGIKLLITQEDIEYEREKNKKDKNLDIANHNFADGYLETISVYRKIGDYFSYNDGAVFHGALIEKNGEGFLFTANSGTGKTTHIRNWIKAFPETRILNGDKPILTINNGVATAYGTPWSGKENYNINDSVKLKAIVILSRDSVNHIEKMPQNSAITTILSQTNIPLDNMGMARALDFAIKLVKSTPIYSLGCNMDVDSAIVAYEGMNN